MRQTMPITIPITEATTSELIDRAIAERVAPGLEANHWRPDFAEFKDKRLWAELHQKTMLRKLKTALGDLRGRRVLDLGTGRGGLSVALAREGCSVVAFDLRGRNLEMTVLRGRRYGLAMPVAVGKGEHLPFADQSFDLVICKDMLEHCQAPHAVLREIRRILTPDGAAYLTVVNRFPFRDPHYHLWFVNFLPARLADRYIDWRGRGKQSFGDRQRLSDMHYYTLPRFRALARRQGLEIRRDVHGLGRRPGPTPAGKRLGGAVRRFIHRVGSMLSIGVTCFELLVERTGPLILAIAMLAALAPRAGAGAAGDFGLTSLRPGLRLEVRVKQRGERFSASRVTLKPDRGHDIEIKAPIDPGSGAAGAERSIHLLGRPVTLVASAETGAETTVADLLDQVGPGSWVKVRGRDRGDRIDAESISLRSENDGPAEIEGPIERVKPRGSQVLVEIGGFEIEVDEDARFFADGQVVAAARQRPTFMDDDDARPQSIRLLDGRVAIGGQLRGDIDPLSDFDLNSAASDDQTIGAMTAQVQVDAQLAPRLAGFGKVSLIRLLGLREPNDVDLDQSDLRFEELYLGWQPIPLLAIQLGRQDFDEPREWLYDENLDAVRLYFTPHRRVAIEAAVAGQLTADGTAQDDGYGVILGRAALGGKTWAGAYAIGRNNPSAGDDGRWYGFRAMGAPRRGIDPWLEVSLLRGASAGARRHEGNAVDLGATVEPLALLGYSSRAVPLRPAFTLGYARGSGDESGADAIDGTFRQTSFQDNTDSFSGVTSFNYYGELLDAELSNLTIWTVGAGFHLAGNTSLDLVYHRYEQVVADNRLRSDLDVEPTGDNPFIGSAVDLIIGMEEFQNLEIEVDVAAFMPGRAFAPPAATATRTSFQLKWNF
jgi:ubiquinone/menaquinone biosynthesis C-methylase UbiE